MSSRQSNLNQILSQVPFETSKVSGDIHIGNIVADSRKIQPGDLFVAVRGNVTDGHQFITDAIDKGAIAIIGSSEIENLSVPYIRVNDSKRALAHLAAAFYEFPARRLTVIGVTGTDGKTTTINLIFEILRAAGIQAGMISTVNAIIGDQYFDTGFHVTTPDAPDIQRYLSQMVDAGMTHVLLEATSHGLEQFRVEACEFDIGVLTNITHEHLDFHGTFESYRTIKSKLFKYLVSTVEKPNVSRRVAILNRDDTSYPILAEEVTSEKISYGFNQNADIWAENVNQDPGGWSFDVSIKEKRQRVTTNLIGNFNVSNCLAALSTTVGALGVEINYALSAISSFKGVPGRMEVVDLGQEFLAVVDFAHTPNALKSALETARTLTNGRVIAVFGSAGLRDREKRRLMAETSIQLADLTILTAEDPRTESLDEILDQMARGAHMHGGREDENFWRIPDRGEAIRFALRSARRGDLVIVCGKGHEQSMCFGQTEYPWDDRIAVRAALSKQLGLPGPEMPYLPTRDQ